MERTPNEGQQLKAAAMPNQIPQPEWLKDLISRTDGYSIDEIKERLLASHDDLVERLQKNMAATTDHDYTYVQRIMTYDYLYTLVHADSLPTLLDGDNCDRCGGVVGYNHLAN